MSYSDSENTKPTPAETMAEFAAQFAEFMKFMNKSRNKSENTTSRRTNPRSKLTCTHCGGKTEDDKSKLTCTHCGGKRHTHETCFHIHGYPEWWHEMKRARQSGKRGTGAGGGGRAAAVAGGDRATCTVGSVGNISASTPPPPLLHLNSGGGIGAAPKYGTNPANTAKSSISISQNWTEGEIGRENPGESGDRRGSRILAEAAASSEAAKGGEAEITKETASVKWGEGLMSLIKKTFCILVPQSSSLQKSEENGRTQAEE